jgi:tetratricopeptide (TPR) repeat protein
MELNAVERRLVDVQHHWQDFLADENKRLLLWQIPDGANRLLEAFFEAQQHDGVQDKPYGCAETFVVFDTPFDNSVSYSRALKQALAGQYDASQEALAEVGREADWQFQAESLPDSAAGFVEGLNSLARHHRDVLGLLVAVILPSSVTAEPAWVDWLGRALDAAPDEGVRLIALDSLEHPRCSPLADSNQPQLRAEPLPIDAIELAAETFAQEPAVGAPGVFRNLLTGLLGLVEKGSPEQVMIKANDAIEFARKQEWLDQEVVVRMMAAGSMLKARRFDEAVTHFRHARACAEKVTASGHPAGRDLELQSWFGEASAHYAAKDLPQAIRCYQEAEPVAEAIPKPVLWIECLRMAAFCQRQNDDDEEAAASCERALQVGERMQPDARVLTTLPLVALEHLRLIDDKRTGQLEAIKQSLERGLAQAHQALEQAAARLEGSATSGDELNAMEQAMNDKTERLEQAAASEIDTLAATGSTAYREAFEHLRQLLWPEWPLNAPAQEAQEEPAQTETEEMPA